MTQINEEPQRRRRSKPLHSNVDLTKPINTEEIMSVEEQGSCFGLKWDMTSKQCPLCADNEVCGAIYSQVQRRIVKAMEKDKPKTLDQLAFDSLDKDKMMMWLSTNTRTTKELVAKIMIMAKCDDRETVVHWVKAFIMENPRIYTSKGIVYIRPKER